MNEIHKTCYKSVPLWCNGTDEVLSEAINQLNYKQSKSNYNCSLTAYNSADLLLLSYNLNSKTKSESIP